MPHTKPPLALGPPTIPSDLVAYLEAIYPNTFPDVAGSDAGAIALDLSRHAGRLEVVKYLRAHCNRQTLKSPPNAATA